MRSCGGSGERGRLLRVWSRGCCGCGMRALNASTVLRLQCLTFLCVPRCCRISKSHLLTQHNAESLYLRIKYHQLDASTISAPPQDFTVRVLYPEGSSVIHTFSPHHTVDAAIERAVRNLTGASLAIPSQATGGTPQWVLQVPSTGEVLRSGEQLLGTTEHVQLNLNYRRTPLLRLCSREDAEDFMAFIGDEADGVSDVVQQLIGHPLSWSSESEEVTKRHTALRRERACNW